ncbi:hypothetical protein WN943_007047 [Citrus x changshan-huyou]
MHGHLFSALNEFTLCLIALQESKLYGAHFREISADAPKAKRITFNNSDDED